MQPLPRGKILADVGRHFASEPHVRIQVMSDPLSSLHS
jgi:hypothetical protein